MITVVVVATAVLVELLESTLEVMLLVRVVAWVVCAEILLAAHDDATAAATTGES